MSDFCVREVQERVLYLGCQLEQIERLAHASTRDAEVSSEVCLAAYLRAFDKLLHGERLFNGFDRRRRFRLEAFAQLFD